MTDGALSYLLDLVRQHKATLPQGDYELLRAGVVETQIEDALFDLANDQARNEMRAVFTHLPNNPNAHPMSGRVTDY
ncbi:MAG: hypothetical protein AAGF30_00270 [Pseudomonadota bacterium]